MNRMRQCSSHRIYLKRITSWNKKKEKKKSDYIRLNYSKCFSLANINIVTFSLIFAKRLDNKVLFSWCSNALWFLAFQIPTWLIRRVCTFPFGRLGNFANITQDFLYLVARLLLVGRKLLARHPIYISYGYSFFNMKFPIFMKYLFFWKCVYAY